MSRTTGSVSSPSAVADTGNGSRRASTSSQSIGRRLAKVRWHWLEIVAIPIALIASLAAYWEARSVADALEDERRAARAATAEQVLILGPTAAKDIQATPPPKARSGGGLSGGPSAGRTVRGKPHLEDVPNLVQNYARLPVSEMTIAVDLLYAGGQTETYEIPVGSLPPCRQVGITDGGYFTKADLAGWVKDVITYVYVVDPTGRKWKRYVGQEPIEVTTIPRVDVVDHSVAEIVRTDIQRIDPCG